MSILFLLFILTTVPVAAYFFYFIVRLYIVLIFENYVLHYGTCDFGKIPHYDSKSYMVIAFRITFDSLNRFKKKIDDETPVVFIVLKNNISKLPITRLQSMLIAFYISNTTELEIDYLKTATPPKRD